MAGEALIAAGKQKVFFYWILLLNSKIPQSILRRDRCIEHHPINSRRAATAPCLASVEPRLKFVLYKTVCAGFDNVRCDQRFCFLSQTV